MRRQRPEVAPGGTHRTPRRRGKAGAYPLRVGRGRGEGICRAAHGGQGSGWQHPRRLRRGQQVEAQRGVLTAGRYH